MVAIIGVLVAIAIPIFTAQLERSRESTDLANARSMYAEVMAAAISEDTEFRQADGTYQGVYQPLAQKQDNWQTKTDNLVIGGVPYEQWNPRDPKANGSCTITYNPEINIVAISWGESSGGGGSGDDPGDTPGSAHTNNTRLANGIAETLQQLIVMPKYNVPQNAQIFVTISKDGTVSVRFGGQPAGTLNESEILNALNQAGHVNDDGTVDFDPADDVQSYTIHVHCKGNGDPIYNIDPPN